MGFILISSSFLSSVSLDLVFAVNSVLTLLSDWNLYSGNVLTFPSCPVPMRPKAEKLVHVEHVPTVRGARRGFSVAETKGHDSAKRPL